MNYTELLNFLWRVGTFSGQRFDGLNGERITVVSGGDHADGVPGVWMAAEIIVDGERRRGMVAIEENTPVPDGTVLRVTCERNVSPVLGMDNRLVTQIHYTLPPEVVQCYDTLRNGAGTYSCAEKIASMPSLHRTSLYTSLLVERLQRKTMQIAEIFEAADQDWNQTFHVLMLQAMGGDKNREAFTALAGKATAAMVSREKSSVLKVEALLLGSAGFLFGGSGGKGDFDGRDDYTMRLEEEARHLLAKYSIVPIYLSISHIKSAPCENGIANRIIVISADTIPKAN